MRDLGGMDNGRLEFAFIAPSKIAEDRQLQIFHRLRDTLQSWVAV